MSLRDHSNVLIKTMATCSTQLSLTGKMAHRGDSEHEDGFSGQDNIMMIASDSNSSENLAEEVELSLKESSFEACAPMLSDAALSPSSPREGPPSENSASSSDSSSLPPSSPSSQRYISKSQLYVDDKQEDAAEVPTHLGVSPQPNSSNKINEIARFEFPKANDNNNGSSPPRHTKIDPYSLKSPQTPVTFKKAVGDPTSQIGEANGKLFDSSSIISKCLGINPAAQRRMFLFFVSCLLTKKEVSDQIDQQSIDASLRIPSPPSASMTPRRSNLTQKDKDDLLPVVNSLLSGPVSSMQKKAVKGSPILTDPKETKISLPIMEINVDDNASNDSISILDDTSLTKDFNNSGHSRGSDNNSSDDSETKNNQMYTIPAMATPKKATERAASRITGSAVAVATTSPGDRNNTEDITSPVLTKSMHDYILGKDTASLPNLDPSNFILTKEMFDYIMGKENEEDEEDSTVVGSDLIVDNPITSTEDSVKLMKNFNREMLQTLCESPTTCASSVSSLTSSDKSFDPHEIGSSIMDLIKDDEMSVEEEIVFKHPQLKRKPSSPKRSHKRRSSYKIQAHPTIYEDYAFEEDSSTCEPKKSGNRKPKVLEKPPPPPSSPPPSVAGTTCLSPDIRPIHMKRSNRSRGKKFRFLKPYRYFVVHVAMIGVLLAALLNTTDPGFSETLLSWGPTANIVSFVSQKPPPIEEVSKLPKNPVAKAWKKFRSRRKRASKA